MNYIKRLHHENETLQKQITEQNFKLIELERYLLSGKFHCGDELDGYVNVQDILNRIRD